MLSAPSGVRRRRGHAEPNFLHFFTFLFFCFDFGLASVFLTYLNNPIGQPDNRVKAVVMDLLLLT